MFVNKLFISDGSGRKIKVTYHDGNETYAGLRWAFGRPDAPYSTLYYSYKQSSSTSPALVFYDKYRPKMCTVIKVFAGEHNVFGELVSQTDALGNKTCYMYDDLGRVLTEEQ